MSVPSSSFLPASLKGITPAKVFQKSVFACRWSWRTWNAQNNSNPIRTAVLTAGSLWAIGNVFCQKRIEKLPEIQEGRLMGAITYGSVVTGYASYYWYSFLDSQVVARGFLRGSSSFVFAKLGAELLLWQPATLCIFWVLLGMFEGKKYRDALAELKSGFLDGLKVEWSIWTPTQSINFFFIPVQYQVLCVNLACLVEAIVLSFLHAAEAKKMEEEQAAAAAASGNKPTKKVAAEESAGRNKCRARDKEAALIKPR